MKKILVLITCILLCFTTVLAEEDKPTEKPDKTEEKEEPKETTQDELGLKAKSAILIDIKTGNILYQKNATEKVYPASVTKILTAYIAIQNLDLGRVLTADKEAIDTIDRSSSHIALDYGEEISVEDALYATLLQSANDAANVLALGTSGTLEGFSDMMNNTCSALGCKNSNFMNAHGLHDDNHYTCAYDIALIFRNAYHNETFKKIITTRTHNMAATNKNKDERIFANGDKMMFNGEFFYEGALGGKTGYTGDAGYSMVSVAKRDDTELVAVVFGNETAADRYKDTAKLFDYGFENYKTVYLDTKDVEPQVVEIKKNNLVVATVTFTLDQGLYALLPANTDISGITMEPEVRNAEDVDTIEAVVKLSINGQQMGELPMVKEVVENEENLRLANRPFYSYILDGISVATLAILLIVLILRIFNNKLGALE